MTPGLASALSIAGTAAAFLVAINFVTAERRLQRRPRRLYASEDADFRRALGVLLGPPTLPGNSIETLVNGQQIFPAMLAAIASARSTITFETFIYWSGDIGRDFSAALAAAARRGVRVHVLLDWIGSRRMDADLLRAIRDAGAEVRIFHEPSWYHLGRLNNRTHRKLLVVDGRLGFTGGVGIAPQWTGNAEDPDHWRDTHFRITGPVVAQMQAVFLDNWIKATGIVLHGDEYFPQLEKAGDVEAQCFGSSPAGGSDSMHLMLLLAITAAHRSIDIVNSYFVPDDLTLEALVAAAGRGVKVRILVPGRRTDVAVVRRASQCCWGQLLDAGVKIYEYLPTMIHCKVMVVDSHWTSVGSANFDNRSFRLNDEANLNAFDPAFAQLQTELMERDLAHSRPITVERWRRRPPAQRFREAAVSLVRSQL